MERRLQPARDEQLKRTMREVAGRVRKVCGDMPAAEFDRLVEQMAVLQIKYSTRRSMFSSAKD